MRIHTKSIIYLLCLVIVIPTCSIADIIVKPEYQVGEDITISGFTNFNSDNSVLIEIWPASFGPKGKYESSMTGGGARVVPVLKGNGTLYNWNGSFDSSDWGPDSYMVRAEVIGKDSAETVTFTLVEHIPGPLAVQDTRVQPGKNETVMMSSPGVTSEETSLPTPVPTSPQPVPTQKSPIASSLPGVSILVGIMGYIIAYRRQ